MAEWIHTDKGWRYKQEKVHLLRAQWHDYHAPTIYMLTLTTVNREPMFGRLIGDVDNAEIDLTPVGKMVSEEIEQIPQYKGFESTEIFRYVVMPDHIHILLYVRKTIKHPLGYYVSWFKKQCSDKGSALAANSASTPTYIFAPEYHDRILTHEGQLDNLRQYIEDNPRRLAIKLANPNLFRLHQNLSYAGLDFSGLGNLFLLDYPLKQVLQCSRTLSQEQIDSLKQQCLIKADCGTVVISAGVSEGEKQICRALRESGYPLIILLKDGFPAPADPNSKYFKPKGVYFETCAEGRLLLLEPKPEAFERPDIIQTVNHKHPHLPHTISRYRFLALNAMADILHAYQGFCSRG